MKNLVIVESPHKSSTIGAYLGSDYKVVASVGHIRDLATSGKFGLGVDVENDFTPNYIPIKGKKKLINSLIKDVKNSDKIYLATDPDREGEAISWHLKEALEIENKSYERIVFNEITKNVVLDSFNHSRKIDMDLVKSQETRRILDRIIGFRLSKLMQSKTGGKSAGRVQSAVLKLIVDREREIEKFVEEEYYTIEADFKDFSAQLEKYHGKKIELKSNVEADKVLNDLSNAFKIESCETKEKLKASKPVFKTSTLQQAAVNKLGFPSSKTMSVAQKLYEGIDLGKETVGLITYMRTDSERISPVFINETFDFIKNNYGDNYLGVVKKTKKKETDQDAHEGIRPTSIKRTPESIKNYLSTDEYKLYSLIYYRALASLMANAKTNATTLILENNGYTFKATGSVITFDGYLKVFSDYEDNKDVVLPDFANYESNTVIANKVEKTQHFTKPLPRYTESSLIKEMETLGIGRPSTYANTLKTLKDRAYVTLVDKKFQPTQMGIKTTDKLQEYFSSIINVEYTAKMEDDLDLIAEAKEDNIKVLKDFYNEFEPLVEDAFSNMEKVEAEKTGEVCPNCGNDLVIRNGRYGKFVACSNYPECKYIKKEEKVIVNLADCPKCDGHIIERKTKRGKSFYGCSNYPKCDYASWYKPTGEKCPSCGDLLVEKKKEIVCNKCDYQK
jgi:DNA topoisomerase-1